MLSSHYRGPINYSADNLMQADAGLERLYLALRGIAPAAAVAASAATERFNAAMDDDINTPLAIAELQTLAREINSARAAGDLAKAGQMAAELRALGGRLGLLGLDPETFLRKVAKRNPADASAAGGKAKEAAGGSTPELSDADIERLIGERGEARKAKNFKESDRIRDLLATAGVLLEDQPGGKTLWRRGR
jgi:cysteinyl-tRNA synthetase